MLPAWMREIVKASVPLQARRWLRSQQKLVQRSRTAGKTRGELLEQTTPVSTSFGMDRGQPLDRYYIERFIQECRSDICGHVLEVEDDLYTTRFGGNRVETVDILHVQQGNPRATIVADLSAADFIASERFDCIILTQTLQFIYDVRAAVATLHRILKSKGVLLATVPGISQISHYDMKQWGDYWRFTTRSVSRLFEERFRKDNLQVHASGNALVASAFLHGLAAEELNTEELAVEDSDYQFVITIRAMRE